MYILRAQAGNSYFSAGFGLKNIHEYVLNNQYTSMCLGIELSIKTARTIWCLAKLSFLSIVS